MELCKVIYASKSYVIEKSMMTKLRFFILGVASFRVQIVVKTISGVEYSNEHGDRIPAMSIPASCIPANAPPAMTYPGGDVSRRRRFPAIFKFCFFAMHVFWPKLTLFWLKFFEYPK